MSPDFKIETEQLKNKSLIRKPKLFSPFNCILFIVTYSSIKIDSKIITRVQLGIEFIALFLY